MNTYGRMASDMMWTLLFLRTRTVPSSSPACSVESHRGARRGYDNTREVQYQIIRGTVTGTVHQSFQNEEFA